MGLDITAHESVAFLKSDSFRHGESEWERRKNVTWLRPNESFPQSDGLESGYYHRKGESYSFRAGSYSGYNEWRNQLCRAALGVDAQVVWDDLEDYKDRPFVSLINFSDCEGIIGPVTSKKLFDDFVKHYEQVYMNHPDDYFRARYLEWSHAFQLASKGGVVKFH